ncbi:hypothetical protein JX265_004656 [Neoarthrinium moseri]|uniref:Ankyrin n=1 Tax=Neoarthrinium moseri TaxID=1658444 RepID=A0A9P9WQA0_9PEZI|nr:hypothetical protein JX265_004656 [Neoarthrinium moseri]
MALGEACKRGNMKMATFLLKNGMVADGLARAAGAVNNVAMIDLLLDYGADISANDGEAFRAAGGARCKKVTGRLLEESMVSSELTNHLGVALQQAAWYAGLPFVKWLVDVQGAPVNHVGPPYASGISPPSLLIRASGKLNGIGGRYHTPLQAAAFFYPEMIGPLLDAGADVNARGGRFGTALHAAAINHDLESVQLLLTHGADAKISTGKYGLVLTCAAKSNRSGHRDRTLVIMDLLLKAGVDVHCTGGKYGSAVQMAAKTGNVVALKWLANHGADIRVKGGRWRNADKAALKESKICGRTERAVVSWLEQHYGRQGWD